MNDDRRRPTMKNKSLQIAALAAALLATDRLLRQEARRRSCRPPPGDPARDTGTIGTGTAESDGAGPRHRAPISCRPSRPTTIFFDTDTIRSTARTGRRSTPRPPSCSRYPTSASRSRAMPTSAAPANTISRSANAAPTRPRTTSHRAASSAGRMTTISYGKERPRSTARTRAPGPQNRRAVTVVPN